MRQNCDETILGGNGEQIGLATYKEQYSDTRDQGQRQHEKNGIRSSKEIHSLQGKVKEKNYVQYRKKLPCSNKCATYQVNYVIWLEYLKQIAMF